MYVFLYHDLAGASSSSYGNNNHTFLKMCDLYTRSLMCERILLQKWRWLVFGCLCVQHRIIHSSQAFQTTMLFPMVWQSSITSYTFQIICWSSYANYLSSWMFLLLLMLLFVVVRTCNMLWAAENSSCEACVVKLMIAVGVYGGEVWRDWQQWARNWMACRTSGQCSLSGLVWSFLNCSMLEMCAWNLAAAAAFCTTFHQMFLHTIPPKQTLFDTGSVKFEHWVCIFARRLCTWSNLGTSCDVGNFSFCDLTGIIVSSCTMLHFNVMGSHLWQNRSQGTKFAHELQASACNNPPTWLRFLNAFAFTICMENPKANYFRFFPNDTWKKYRVHRIGLWEHL